MVNIYRPTEYMHKIDEPEQNYIIKKTNYVKETDYNNIKKELEHAKEYIPKEYINSNGKVRNPFQL
jgi:hypothetical protein